MAGPPVGGKSWLGCQPGRWLGRYQQYQQQNGYIGPVRGSVCLSPSTWESRFIKHIIIIIIIGRHLEDTSQPCAPSNRKLSEDSREENVYMAKLAEQAERYDEVGPVL
eukprot:3435848-Rhodomonas_salina.1